MSIERRILFGPGAGAEVYVVPTNDGRSLVLDGQGRPVGVLSAEETRRVHAGFEAPGMTDVFELSALSARSGAVFQAASPGTFAEVRTPDRASERLGAPGIIHVQSHPTEGPGRAERRDHGERFAQDRGVDPRGEAPVAGPEDPERARGAGTGIVRFALLGQIRGALAEALAANHALVDEAKGRDRRDTAEDLASAVLQTLGVELPTTTWIPNTRESRTWGGRLRLGDDLVARARLPELVQLLLHETGRIHSPRHAAAAGTVLAALTSAGYLDAGAHAAITNGGEATSLTFAALGAWMFGAAQRPVLSATLAHLEAPEGSARRDEAERLALLGVLVDALDRASAEGAFEHRLARHDGPLVTPKPEREPWIFGDD
jgi:hypothetical protein